MSVSVAWTLLQLVSYLLRVIGRMCFVEKLNKFLSLPQLISARGYTGGLELNGQRETSLAKRLYLWIIAFESISLKLLITLEFLVITIPMSA